MKLTFNHRLPCGLLPCILATTLVFSPLQNGGATSSSEPRAAEVKSSLSVPTDADIFRYHVFQEPLVPVGGQTTPMENAALSDAINSYEKRIDRDDDSRITSFLKQYPKSPWRVALLVNLGLEYRQTGWFLKALTAWEQAWELSKDATEPRAKALADRTIGELAELNARVGRRARVETLLKQIEHRPLLGSATEKIAGAREASWLMRKEPGKAFECGLVALNRLQAFENPDESFHRKVSDVRSTERGMSLMQVTQLARELKMDYVAAKRQPGAKVIVPSVVNWKAEHYAALVKEKNGRFLVQDPTLGGDIWVSQAALDAESSGYFLVRRSELPDGWQFASAKEASRVWGRGNTTSHDPSGTKPNDEKAKKCPLSIGMATYDFHLQTVSLNITDTPLAYDPSIGPAIRFTVTYNHREYYQPAIFNYSNLGQKWTFDWLSYIQDDSTNPAAQVMLYVAGGGGEFYQNFNSTTGRFDPQFQSGSILRRISWSPIQYERTLSDGSREIFGQSNGATGTAREIFLTQRIDSAGNSVYLSYDTSLRLISITDPVDIQPTTLSYELTNDTYKITKVTDPFGRFATFGYTSGQLTSITDTIGIVSQFAYASGSDFITTLTTPYRSTTFTQPSSNLTGDGRVLEATDQASGERERVEYGHGALGIIDVDPNVPTVPNFPFLNNFHSYRNSFYWDKKAMAMYPPVNGVPDYTKAKLTQWLHTLDQQNASNIKEREKAPLENPAYYFYPGQNTSTWIEGTSGLPGIVAQKLADGTSRVTQLQRNALGSVTQKIDPVGRTFTYLYWTHNPADTSDPANMVDVKEVRQILSGNELLFSATYSPQHRPLTSTDAAGQTASYTYNSFGQVLTSTNAKNETTTFAYGDTVPPGYLASITSPPFNLVSAVTTFTYDSFNRIRTVTDTDQYTVTTDYDNLDRKTRVTYPDTTYEQFQYTDNITHIMTLDLTGSRDRRGLWTYRHYNANRQMDSITDPANQTTTYGWCTCGALTSITDPKLQLTTFNRDLQSRVYQKVFADATTINYLFEGQSAPNTVGATSRLQSATDAKSQRTNYLYFADDTVRQINYTDTAGQQLNPPTPSVTYSYDPNYNRVATMADGIGKTIYAYNSITVPPVLGAGLLASIAAPMANDTITFGYDELGRVTNRAVNGTANSATWSFDSLGRISSETNKLGTFTNTYVGVTPRLSKVAYPNNAYPNNVSANYLYFPNKQDKRLQQIRNLMMSGALMSQFDYTYDVEGQLQTWTKNNPSLPAPQRSDLGYDNADQLLTAPLKDASTNALITQYTYTYDTAANRTSELVATTTTTSTPNYVNEITSQSGGVNRTLTYDLNGSLTNDGSARTFEWDGANRVVAVNYTGTTNRSEFSYDGVSRLAKIVEKTVGSVTSTREIVWCGTEKCEFRDATDAVTLRLYPQGEYSGTIAYFYTRDHLGSIREMLTGGGTVVARYDYDPYGRSTTVIGNTPTDFNYTGLYRHSQSNLDLATYRAYDPDLGRWLSRDPIGEEGGLNLYAYVLGNPVNWRDVLGLDLRLESTDQVGGLHQRVSVDTPSGPYAQSFGMISGDSPMQGSSEASGVQPGSAQPGSGIVYPDSDPTRAVIERYRMTPAEDALAVKALQEELNQTGPYNVFTRSCRDYSQERFNRIKQDTENRRWRSRFEAIRGWIQNLF